jgi:deoxycytidine triphosphate deaminase
MAIDVSNFATKDSEAAERAARYSNEDPLPSIPCALLSSAEIHDYARITGMLFPFDARALKSASYEAHIGGEFISWDEKGGKHARHVSRGDSCILLPNSITFVEVEPQFRLPNYIAIRFNLRITHVHRGLLLGTGPLVDPGFEGKLLIPLHNLTSSEYNLDTTEALIWIEFTKTTFSFKPKEEIASEVRHFCAFPEGKKNRTPDYYLRKANGGNPIRSSIPDAVEEGKRGAVMAAASAANAEKTVTRLRNLLAGIGLVASVGLGIALFGIYSQVVGMVQSSAALSTSVQQGLAPLVADGRVTAEKLSAAQSEIAQLRQQLNQLDGQLNKLKASAPPVSSAIPETQQQRH